MRHAGSILIVLLALAAALHPGSAFALEHFDQPGDDWSPTTFPDLLLAGDGTFERQPLTTLLGAPDTDPPLPINAGGDKEGRYFEQAFAPTSSFALTQDLPENDLTDVTIDGYLAIGFTEAFGSRSLGFLVRATAEPAIDGYIAHLGNGNPAVMSLNISRYRDGVITVDDVLATSQNFAVDLSQENYRLEFTAEGTLLTAALARRGRRRRRRRDPHRSFSRTGRSERTLGDGRRLPERSRGDRHLFSRRKQHLLRGRPRHDADRRTGRVGRGGSRLVAARGGECDDDPGETRRVALIDRTRRADGGRLRTELIVCGRNQASNRTRFPSRNDARPSIREQTCVSRRSVALTVPMAPKPPPGARNARCLEIPSRRAGTCTPATLFRCSWQPIAVRSGQEIDAVSPELKRWLDYSDLLAAPDDGKQYELVRGDLFVNPSPSPAHQRISRRLQRQMEDFFHDRAIGEVFNAPIDLILTNRDVFVPDLLVVTEPRHVTKRGIEGPPLVVVEILSPSTQKTDRGTKARRYAELGVLHYWIVDPVTRRFECHRLAGETYRLLIDAEGETELAHPDWDGLVIDLAALWRK